MGNCTGMAEWSGSDWSSSRARICSSCQTIVSVVWLSLPLPVVRRSMQLSVSRKPSSGLILTEVEITPASWPPITPGTEAIRKSEGPYLATS